MKSPKPRQSASPVLKKQTSNSITTIEATKGIIEIISKYDNSIRPLHPIWLLEHADELLAIGSTILLMHGCFISKLLFHGTSIFAIALFGISLATSWQRDKLRNQETRRRLQEACESLQERGVEYGELREPPSRAINLIRTFRDRDWKMVPPNLLVLGDLVQLSTKDDLGKYIEKIPAPDFGEDFFRIIKSPLEVQLASCRRKEQAEPLTFKFGIMTVLRLGLSALLCLFYLFIIISKRLRDDTCSAGMGSKLIIFSLAFHILCSPIWNHLFFCYGNARILCLVEVLQKSKTPYIEAEDVDEFDEEAPPPTKDITISLKSIFDRTQSAIMGQSSDFLFWKLDLAQTFASVSVVSFLDREGLISTSFPMPLECTLPNPITKGELAFGEFIVDSLNPSILKPTYADNTVKNDNLKALGLCLMLTTSCGVHKGQFHKDLHSRFPANIYPGQRLDPVFRTCTCSISRELGFSAGAATDFIKLADFWIIRKTGISVSLNPIEYQGLYSRIVKDRKDGQLHMVSLGDLTSIVCQSQYQWNSNEIIPLEQTLRKKLIELDDNLAASDLQCIGICYKPIITPQETELSTFLTKDGLNVLEFSQVMNETMKKDKMSSLTRNQIFIGALISGYEPKDDFQELIDDLENSGIRFVYFSPYSASITRAFGSRLGLETDWNSCIILSQPGKDNGLEVTDDHFTDPKSKLPRGVYKIRPHLCDVDDIPLHVSLFAESDSQSITEMHKIYKENDESVITIGSSLNWTNAEVFASAPLSIAMEPPQLGIGTKKTGRVSLLKLSSSLTSLMCSFILPFDCSPYVLTEIIREARSLSRGQRESYALRIALCITLGISILISNEDVLQRSIIFVLLGLINALILLFSPYEPNIMKLMPVSRKKTNGGISHSTQQSFNTLRAMANGIILGIGCMIVHGSAMIFTLSLVMSGICSTYLHTHNSLVIFGIREHQAWTLMTILLLIISFTITMITCDIKYFQLFTNVIKSLIVSIIAIAVNETFKLKIKADFERSEKRAKLHFNTKLGMHSPV